MRKLGHAYIVERDPSGLGIVSLLRDRLGDCAVVDVLQYGEGWLVITARPFVAKPTARSATKEPLDVVEQLAAERRE